jgi:hypothetical protein
MAKNPAFPFYANDFLVDTLRWSRGMKSLHVDLMCESWSNKEVRNENGYPAGLNEEDQNLWVKIKHKWVLVGNIWTNEKLEECRKDHDRFLQKQKENGRKGGRPTEKEPKNNPRLFLTETQTIPKPNPLEEEDEREEEKEKEKVQEIESEPIELPDPQGNKVVVNVSRLRRDDLGTPEAWLEEWTAMALKGTDYVLAMMEKNDVDQTGIPWPQGFERDRHILDHRDMAIRYGWKFHDYQSFRYSLLKVLRDSKKKHFANGNPANRKQEHTSKLVSEYLTRHHGDAPA